MTPLNRKTGSAVLACITLALFALGQAAPSREAAPPASTQPAKPAEKAPSDRGTPAGDPSVRTPPQVSPEDLLKEFQKDRPRAVPIPPSGAADEEILSRRTTTTTGGRRLPDGYFLVDRVGRLTRDCEWWIFVFEGYNETHPEPPMKMLPNQLLERMVIESEEASSTTVFVVSGEVTEFQGENYLLLRKLLLRRNLGNLEK